MDRIFLDANVLFSAAYREGAGLLKLWELPGIGVMTSGYAAEEARRNLDDNSARARLDKLLERTAPVPEAPHISLPRSIKLPEKDRPILKGAIAAQATSLITGDLRDFGPFFGKSVASVPIETPGEFLRMRARRSHRSR